MYLPLVVSWEKHDVFLALGREKQVVDISYMSDHPMTQIAINCN